MLRAPPAPDTAGSPMVSMRSRPQGAPACTLSLRATASTWSMSWSPGEESSLSGSEMSSARWRQSTLRI
eukprot:scaffold79826_cov60-Phaeocystis_antarctica.AAC.1